MSFTTSNNTTSTNTSSGLQTLYAFDEGSGTTVTDSSGNGRNGTISGATWATGKIGGGLGFDGVNDYVTISQTNGFDFGNSVKTIAGWF